MASLKNVKEKEHVIVSDRHMGDHIALVEKITPTGLIKVHGVLYNASGSPRGSDWGTSHLEEATPAKMEKIRQEEKIRLCKIQFKHREINYEQAIAILDILLYK